jgi:hypothetical protein
MVNTPSTTRVYEVHPTSGLTYWLTCAMALACGSGALFAAFHSGHRDAFTGGLGLLFLFFGLAMLIRRRSVVDTATRMVLVESRLFGILTLWSRCIPFSEFDRVLVRRESLFVYLRRRSGRKVLVQYFNASEGSAWDAAAALARRLSADLHLEIDNGASGANAGTDADPYPHRMMRPFWRWHIRILVASVFVAFGLFIWRSLSVSDSLDWYLWLPFAMGGLMMLYMHRFVHCPRCARRLRVRKVREHGRGDSWRYLYDCPDCQITWDSQYVQDASSD